MMSPSLRAQSHSPDEEIDLVAFLNTYEAENGVPQGQTAPARLAQNSTSAETAAATGGGHGRTIAIILGIAGAAAVGTVFALSRGGDSPSAPSAPTTTITLGEPNVGGSQ